MGNAAKFSLDLSAFVAKAKANGHAVVRRVVLDVGTSLVDKSPVGDRELWAANIDRAERGLPPLPKGYVGGRFRGNWQYGNMSEAGVPMAELPDIDPTGQVSIERINAALPTDAAGKLHIIKNNLPYAQKLEDGHSSQAPSGMVGLTVIEYQGIVSAAAASVNK